MTGTPQPYAGAGVLERFLEQMVVDEYADVAAGEARSSRPLAHWPALVVMVVIGLLLTTAVIATNASDDQRQATRDALISRVSALSADVTARQSGVDAASARVDALRASVLAADDIDAGALDDLSAHTGATAVSGPGLTVTVDDAPGAAAGSLNRVLDRDLQDIVNALWRDGATAVAVNDQRLVATTAIRGAGDAILVNYQPLTRPYVISAVGPSGTRLSGDGVATLLEALRADYGLVADVTAGDVALPAGEVRAPRFAQVDEGASAQ